MTGLFVILLTTPPSSYYAYQVYLFGGLKVSYTFFNLIFYWYPIGLIIGILPTFIIYFLTKKRWERISKQAKNKEAGSSDTGEYLDEKIEIAINSNSKDKLILSVKDFLYVESQRNYVIISFLKDNKTESLILRTTLSQVAESLQTHPNIIQCHRSFIVNLSHVNALEGNSRTSTLNLHNTNIKIPVSRSYIKHLKNQLGY